MSVPYVLLSIIWEGIKRGVRTNSRPLVKVFKNRAG